MSLSGQQCRQLQSALIDAFSTIALLEQMLLYELNKSLKAIAGEGSLQEIVFKLIQEADSQGWVEKLICAAYASNSGNQKLQSFIQKLSLKKSNDLRAIIENQLECDYDNLEELGTGASGITYLATVKNQDKYLVIKTIKFEELYKFVKSKNQETLEFFSKVRESFEKEAEILSRFKHPNIVKYHDYFTQKFNLVINFNEQNKKLYSVYELELLFLVMEYIEGESLEDFISTRSVPLEETEALRYVQQIGNALILVHSQGVLHRDIKPQNIIVRKATFDAVLIDFGIAREFNPILTQTLTVAFTQGYAPPEQLEPRSRQGNYTDVYGLAATLYYLLTKEHPPHAMLRNSNSSSLVEPKKINSNISDTVNEIILWGMELEPSKRPQTVQQWLAKLLSKETRVELKLSQEILTQPSILEPAPAKQQQQQQVYRVDPDKTIQRPKRKKTNKSKVVAPVIVVCLVVLMLFVLKPQISAIFNSLSSIYQFINKPITPTPTPATSLPTNPISPVPKYKPNGNEKLAKEITHFGDVYWSKHQGSVLGLAFSPRNQNFATSGKDRLIRLWNTQGKKLGESSPLGDTITSIDFSQDGQQLVSAEDDGTVRLWNLQEQQIGSGTIRLWNLLWNLQEQQSGSVKFSPNSQPLTHAGKKIRSVKFSPDGHHLAIAGEDGYIHLWDLQGQSWQNKWSKLADPTGVWEVAFSPDHQQLAIGENGGLVTRWNLQNWKRLNGFPEHKNPVLSVAFSPDSKHMQLISGCKGGMIRIWDSQKEQQKPEMEMFYRDHDQSRAEIKSIAFNPKNSNLIVSGDNKGNIKLWKLKPQLSPDQEKPVLTLSYIKNSSVNKVTFSPDGKKLAAATADGIVTMFDSHLAPTE
jgi:WD40 repeat protein/predicted Ser/Thr protein kinase